MSTILQATEAERVAANRKRDRIRAAIERRQQDSTKCAATAILVFAAAAAATAAAKRVKSKPHPRMQTDSRPTTTLDTSYSGKNIITPQDAAQANLPHLGPLNTLICNANRGVSKATAKTRVNRPGLPPEASNGIIAPQA